MSTFIRSKDGKYEVRVNSKDKITTDVGVDYYIDEYVNGEHTIRYTADKKIMGKFLRWVVQQFISKYGKEEYDRMVDSSDVMSHKWSKKKSKIVWVKVCEKCNHNRKECKC